MCYIKIGKKYEGINNLNITKYNKLYKYNPYFKVMGYIYNKMYIVYLYIINIKILVNIFILNKRNI